MASCPVNDIYRIKRKIRRKCMEHVWMRKRSNCRYLDFCGLWSLKETLVPRSGTAPTQPTELGRPCTAIWKDYLPAETEKACRVFQTVHILSFWSESCRWLKIYRATSPNTYNRSVYGNSPPHTEIRIIYERRGTTPRYPGSAHYQTSCRMNLVRDKILWLLSPGLLPLNLLP